MLVAIKPDNFIANAYLWQIEWSLSDLFPEVFSNNGFIVR